MRETLKYFGYGLLIGVGLLAAGLAVLGCGDNENGELEVWVCADCPDIPPATASGPDARPLQADAAPDAETLPDAASLPQDAPEADAPAETPDAAPPPSCDETTCSPDYGYCANVECLAWPSLPPPETWACCRDGADNLGCCVSTCQAECDLNLPNSLWTACGDACELRCKSLLGR